MMSVRTWVLLPRVWRFTVITLSMAMFLFVLSVYQTDCLNRTEQPHPSIIKSISPREMPSSLTLSERVIAVLSPVFPSLNSDRISKINLSTIGRITTFYDLDNTFNKRARRQPTTMRELFMFYQPIITQEEKDIMLVTFQTFIRACELANLSYFLYGGTLLGAYRHHGVIPWDDDIDVMMNSSDKGKLHHVLSQFPSYGVHAPSHRQWKFFRKDLPTLPHKPYRWPYIDIFFFLENSNYIWDESPNYRQDFNYSKSEVFPLQYRPFERAILPVPCNMEKVLSTNYLINVCTTSTYIHKLESDKPDQLRMRVHCRHLFPLYPFVFRTTDDYGNYLEEQKRGDRVLSTVTLPPFCRS